MASVFQRVRVLLVKLALITVNMTVLMLLLVSFHHPSEEDSKSSKVNVLKAELGANFERDVVGVYSIEVVLVVGVVLISGIIIVIKEHLVCSIGFAAFNVLVAILSISGLQIAILLTTINAALSIWFAIELYFKQQKVIACNEFKQAQSLVRRVTIRRDTVK